MWNPSDPRIAMPRLFGLGWTVNFGAIAVRLGLMRPDDIEARPFENLSARAVGAAVAVPVATGIVALVVTGLFWSRLPSAVPTHFTGAGVADDWAPKAIVLGALLAIAAGLPAVVLAWHAFRRASRAVVATTSVVLALLSVLAAVILGYTVANAVYGIEGWWIGALIVGSLVVPGVMLYLLARASLRQEWRATTESRGRDSEERAR
jgi:cobalamin synthase